MIEKCLIEEKSLGIKSLDKIASEYCGHYDESDSQDMKTALGFSIYNGPEWVWIYGFYLKGLLKVH